MEIDGVNFSIPEMIETIWEAKASGKFGTYESMGMAGSVIRIDGKKYGVWQEPIGKPPYGGCYGVHDHSTGLDGYGNTVLEAAQNATYS